MTEHEKYQEHIRHTHDAFCKTVIRHAAIDAARSIRSRRKREISLEYLIEEKHYPFSTTDKYFAEQSGMTSYPLFVCGQMVLLESPELAATLSTLSQILYYRGKIVGGIYDDRLLVKKTRSALELMPAAICELPYEGAKEMVLVDEVDRKAFLAELVEAMYDELFSLQSPHLCNMKQNGYQTTAFECFALMPFYDIVSFTAATAITGYRNSSVSFCNTASF